jgi:hypothetical protein
MEEAQTEVQKTEEANAEQQSQVDPNNVLFGIIGYKDDEAYENFIRNLTPDQAVYILVASANFAQKKGAYGLLEAETLAAAIRVLRKVSPEQPKEEN